jgi:hypothetical protein
LPGGVGQDRLAAGLVKIGLPPGNIGLAAVTREALPGFPGQLPTCRAGHSGSVADVRRATSGFPLLIRRAESAPNLRRATSGFRPVAAGQKVRMPPGKRRASRPLPA